MILNQSNDKVWSAGSGGERFEFLKDGDLALYSYSNDAEMLWRSNTSLLLSNDRVNYADRAILYDDGQLFIIDNTTLSVQSVHNKLSANESYKTVVSDEYN